MSTMTIAEIENDFKVLNWDCDICPLTEICKQKGFMFTEDCVDDCLAYWKKRNIRPEVGILTAAQFRIK